jgi:hypothetical protein
VLAELIFTNASREDVKHWAEGIKVSIRGMPGEPESVQITAPETGGDHNEVCCRAERDAFACTLPKGHAGRHEAWGSAPLKPRYLINSWPAEETSGGKPMSEEDVRRVYGAGKRAYYETHEPPHCPTCDCGAQKTS